MSRCILVAVFLAGCSSANDGFDDLRNLPEVASVTVTGPTGAPKTLIHVRDYHYVSRDLYAREAGSEQDYEDFLNQVEQIQLQQVAVLRHLLQKNRISAVLAERITKENYGEFIDRVQTYRKLHRMLADAKDLKGPQGKTIKAEVHRLMDAGRENFLDTGAAGRLLGDLGNRIVVVPLDHERLLEVAKPVFVDGKFRIDQAKSEAREDAMVQVATSMDESVVVVILGGGHDLSDNLPADWRYVRVTVKGYPD